MSKSLSCVETLKNLQLKKFCSQKSYQVEYVTPVTVLDHDLFDQIVQQGKKYQHLSNVHFITYKDVWDFLERLYKRETVDLPKPVKECALELVSSKMEEAESFEFLALVTKLKIIEEMYKKYQKEVSSMQRRQQVHEELAGLLHDCEPKEKEDKKKKKKPKKEKSSKSSKSSKKSEKKPIKKTTWSKTEMVIDDYTDIILEDNDLIFDYDIDNHLIYLLLCNFPDPLLLEELAEVQVDVSAVIDVALASSKCEQPQLEEMFEEPKNKYLEDTAWMKYRSSGKHPLEEFLYVVKKINYVKRQHLAYIKNLRLGTLGVPPKKLEAESLEKYTRLMNSYPCDLVSVPLIISSLVEEICWREQGPVYSMTPSSSTESEETVQKSYQTHEDDTLKMGIYAYKDSGRRCYDDTLKYLKFLHPLSKLEPPNETTYQNRAVSTEDTCYCDNLKYLRDYLHLAIFNQMTRTDFVPKQPEEYDFTSNLVTHNYVKQYQKVLPRVGKKPTVAVNDVAANYHMKEDLSTSVLRQLIYQTMTKYSYCERYFCTETNSVLVRFHDNSDDFGLDTRTWCQNLRTPVCLRDFCRYVVNEGHQLVPHGDVNEESDDECGGLKVPEVYEEYQYLLAPSSGVSGEEKKRIFEETLAEVLNYPRSDSLAQFCSDNGTFLAYDLGPNMCQLTGHTTTFCSDDGVKVTVDTSRFLVEDPKCTLTLDSDGHSVVYHNNRPSAFHFVLRDGTIVSFSETEPQTDVVFSDEDVVSSYEEKKDAVVPNYNDYWIQVLRKSKIPQTLPNFSDKKVKLDDKSLEQLLELFKAAVVRKHPIYKVSTRPSLRHLKRLTSPLNLPLVATLKRVLFKPVPKKRTIGGYSVLNLTKARKVPLKYDFKVTLPNGLAVTTLPRTRRLAEVKQEYKGQYRVFYSNGVILIKNMDGSTTILRSNGDIITLSDRSLECTHAFPNKSSRCVDTPKARVRTEFVNLYEFGDIPYTKKTLLEFSGKEIKVSDGRVTERQQYYVITEHDYQAEEVFYEREDGMSCIVDKKGRRIFQFPDGTRLTSWPEFEKELIHVSDNPKVEGWVSVIVNYKFEHPDYVTVLYDQMNHSTQLFLKDSVIKNTDESFLMSVDKNIALEVTSTNLIFLKTCESCDSDCVCKIHIDEVPKLLEVYDSYGKYLTCDSSGKCELVSNLKDRQGCDHQWRNEKQKLFVLNERGAPGTLLWRDSSIERKFLEAKACKNVKINNYMNKLIEKHTLEFFTEVYQNFVGRFTMTELYKQPICLLKHKQTTSHENRLCYVTYRILIDIQNEGVIPELNDILESRSTRGTRLVEGIKRLVLYFTERRQLREDKLSYRVDMKQKEEMNKTSSISNKSSDLRPTAQDIVAKWKEKCEHHKLLIRNRIFLPYFHSDYYQHVMLNKTFV